MDIFLNFLPHWLIEWFFFLAIFFLFIIGIILLEDSKSSRWRKILNSKANGNFFYRETFESLKDKVTSSATDLFLQALPGIFLIIGLLGTFINLENVLLALDLSQNNRDEQMNQALSDLGSKFKTSIWGLIANISFRIALYRYYGIGLIKIINMYYQSLESEHNKNDAILKTKNEENRRTDIQYMVDTKKLLESLIQSQLQSTQETNGNLKALLTIFQNFDKNTQRLTDAGTNMGNSVTKMEGIIDKVSTKLVETTNSFAKNTEEFTNAVGGFEKKTDTVLKNLNSSILNFNNTVKDSFEGFATEVNKTLDKISGVLTTSTEKMGTSVNESIESMKTEVTNMTNVASKMEKINGNLTDINGELQNEIAEIRKVLDNTNTQFGKLVDTNALYSRRMEELFGAKNGSVKEVFSETGPIGNMMKDTFKKVSYTIELIEKSNVNNTAISEQLIKLMSNLNESINQLNKQLLSVNESNKQNLRENFTKIQDKTNNIEEKTDIFPDGDTK